MLKSSLDLHQTVPSEGHWEESIDGIDHLWPCVYSWTDTRLINEHFHTPRSRRTHVHLHRSHVPNNITHAWFFYRADQPKQNIIPGTLNTFNHFSIHEIHDSQPLTQCNAIMFLQFAQNFSAVQCKQFKNKSARILFLKRIHEIRPSSLILPVWLLLITGNTYPAAG